MHSTDKSDRTFFMGFDPTERLGNLMLFDKKRNKLLFPTPTWLYFIDLWQEALTGHLNICIEVQLVIHKCGHQFVEIQPNALVENVLFCCFTFLFAKIMPVMIESIWLVNHQLFLITGKNIVLWTSQRCVLHCQRQTAVKYILHILMPGFNRETS